MAKAKNHSLTKIIIQIALGLMLAIGGIWGLQGGGDFGVKAIRDVFSGDLGKILALAFSVVELLAGLYLILELFIGDLGKLDNILMFIIMIVWIVAIVLFDFIGKRGIFNGGAKNFLEWLWNFASHLIVLGSIIYCKD